MPKISFVKNKPSLEVESGTKLMQELRNNSVPVASSCKGQLICGKCVLNILEGSENISPPTQEEKDLAELKDLTRDQRFSCACIILGDVKVDAPYW